MDVVWTVLAGLHFESTTLFCQIALFFALHYSLSFLVYQPLMEIRDRRDKRIASNLAAAEAATETARRIKDEYEERVRAARSEGQSALAQAVAAAAAEREARAERARERAGRLLEETRAQAAAAREKAEARMESQTEEVAQVIVARLVTASLGEAAAPVLAKIGGK
jgi:F-type H+-transporting ATPase subunit b